MTRFSQIPAPLPGFWRKNGRRPWEESKIVRRSGMPPVSVIDFGFEPENHPFRSGKTAGANRMLGATELSQKG